MIDAIIMLKKVEATKRALTKDHIKSIIIPVFSATFDKSSKKGEFLDQLNGNNQKDMESKMDRAIFAPPPLPMIPSIPPIEQTGEAPADASVAASGTNTNIDTMGEDPEEEK